MRRLEVLNNTLAQNTKYIVPSSSSLVNVLGLDAAVSAAAGPPQAAYLLRNFLSKADAPVEALVVRSAAIGTSHL
jgi:hypothetical protein